MKTYHKSLYALAIVAIVITAAIQIDGRPDDGSYKYDISFAEYGGQSLDETARIIIKGDSIKVLYAGGGEMMTVEIGTTLDEGLLLKHKSTGKWIIADNPEDANAEEIGGCSDGPQVIDFKKKKFITC